MENSSFKDLIKILPQEGKVEWIGLRPEKRVTLTPVSSVEVTVEDGLIGDHYHGKSKKRQVTLIQAEHLSAVAGMLHRAQIDPGLTRRNIVVSGINLLALKDRQFQIGGVILAFTGLCHPCSRMEKNLGPGGYNAMRGHGGITASVVQGGTIKAGDSCRLFEE